MASIRERNGSYQITVSCGYDIHGKKLIETTTFKPDPFLRPKQREKAVQEFAQQFETKVKDGFPGCSYTVGDYNIEKFIPEQIRILFILAIYTGLRKGELLALQWNDINFETDVIQVSKSITAVNGEFICKSPKTKTSQRTISIPHFLSERLMHLRDAQNDLRIELEDLWQGDNWIFTQDNGKMMNYSTPYQALQDTIARYNQNKHQSNNCLAFLSTACGIPRPRS